MPGYLPEHAQLFKDAIALAERAWRRRGYEIPGRARSEMDWIRLARDLGPDFFDFVKASREASMLIAEPPREYAREVGYPPAIPRTIENVHELILRGVCQVRNNIAHGEKYVELEADRSAKLVAEAHWVLARALEWIPPAPR